MKIIWIGGNHPRHLFFGNALHKEFGLAGAIIQLRENILPQPPDDITELDRQNFIRHFENRLKAEKKYFGRQKLPDCPRLEVAADRLNSGASANFVRSINPDATMIFGSDLIKDDLLSALPANTVNLHLGLSPRYRGAATLFWPFYFMEPAYAGCTFHYIVSEPDAGDVVHQVVPKMEKSDTIHDVACKAVEAATLDALRLLSVFKEKGPWKRFKQKGSGRNFLSNDFKPEHLRVNYNIFSDDMVRHYMEGRIISRRPKLMRQF